MTSDSGHLHYRPSVGDRQRNRQVETLVGRRGGSSECSMLGEPSGMVGVSAPALARYAGMGVHLYECRFTGRYKIHTSDRGKDPCSLRKVATSPLRVVFIPSFPPNTLGPSAKDSEPGGTAGRKADTSGTHQCYVSVLPVHQKTFKRHAHASPAKSRASCKFWIRKTCQRWSCSCRD